MRRTHLLILGLLFVLIEDIIMQDCPVGYKTQRGKCIDEDECEQDLICGENASCFNTVGSYYCQCHTGFKPEGTKSTVNFTQADGIQCKDINECEEKKNDCGSNAECVNTEGGYYCTCKPGFISSNGKKTFLAGLGVQCDDKNECEHIDCGKHATCHSSPGHFYCVCAAGFTLKSGETNYTDTNETCIMSQRIFCLPNKQNTLHALQVWMFWTICILLLCSL